MYEKDRIRKGNDEGPRKKRDKKRNKPEADIGYWRRSEYWQVRHKHTDYHQSVSRV